MARKIHLFGYFVVICMIGILISTVSAIPSQPTLFFAPDVVESNTGDNDQVWLMMDGAFRGLSGYGVILSIDNPEIGSIIDIDIPDWAGLQDIQKFSESSYLIQAVDSNDKIGPGSPKIPLGIIKIHANSPGYLTIRATPVQIDDDQKGRYEPVPVTGTIIITGAGPVPKIPMNT
ncbi:MAG: hypothetical protein LUQ50_14765 [Methanospirillum sp.]|uniref:hypothetical protein n=1 Tax=Methanospirillum sp. TaxID=45200 RepID=UPI00236D0A23|nr:hypothetical protein [Methanospirillum sp.]MDD1730314.1 hypothetical protein [Methanospirillum sp.]